jgi:hypothetical protein
MAARWISRTLSSRKCPPLLLSAAANQHTEEPSMGEGFEVTPTKEHEWLRQLIGDWTYTSVAEMEPGAPKETFTLRESTRALGDIWVVSEGEGEMPDGRIGRMLITLGYDAARKRFVGSWIGSMMTNMWVYDGELDESGRVLTLDCEGPSMNGDGSIGKYRDVIELTPDGERTLKSFTQKPDGSWQQFMVATYQRR